MSVKSGFAGDITNIGTILAPKFAAIDGRVFFTDVYVDGGTVDTAVLSVVYGGPEADSDPMGNNIWVYVNGQRTGGDLAPLAVTPVHEEHNTTGGSFNVDLKPLLLPGRNRITVYQTHYDTNPTVWPLMFAGEVYINGVRQINGSGNAEWFVTPNLGYTRNTSLNILPQEPEDSVHNFTPGGVPILYMWNERFYGLEKWAYDQDPDDDGVDNWHEFMAGANPLSPDTNSDGVLDGDEDADGDALVNMLEQEIGSYPYAHPGLVDTDDDGLWDSEEVGTGNDPTDSLSPAVVAHSRYMSCDGVAPYVVPEVDAWFQDEHALRDWTIEAWIRPDPSNTHGVILRRSVGRYDKASGLGKEGLPAGKNPPNESAAYYYAVNYELGITDGKLYAGFKTAAGLGYRKLATQTLASYATDANGWIYVAGSYSRATREIRLYINGAAVNGGSPVYAAAYPPSTVSGLGGITIGAGLKETGPAPFKYSAFLGGIDDLMLWSQARTDAQISATYTAGAVDTVAGTFVSQTRSASNVVLLPSYAFKAAGLGLVNAFLCDDGGQTFEDFARRDDWLNGWAHALVRPGGIGQPSNLTALRGDRMVTLSWKNPDTAIFQGGYDPSVHQYRYSGSDALYLLRGRGFVWCRQGGLCRQRDNVPRYDSDQRHALLLLGGFV